MLIPQNCEGWIISSNIIRVRVDEEKIYPLFCLYLLKYSPFILRQIRRVTATGGRLLVNTKTLRELKFPVLPLKNQIGIAETIKAMELRIEEIQQHISKINVLLSSVRENLLFGSGVTRSLDEKCSMKSTPLKTTSSTC